MAGVSDRDLRPVGPWPLGINNQAKEGSLPTDENGARLALREADNVDLDAVGWPTRRKGTTPAFMGELTHSLWSNDDLQFGLAVDAGQLHVMLADESVEPLGVMVGSQDLSYALVNDRIFFSNRTTCGMLTLDLQAHRWAPEHPAGQPDVFAIDGFGLHAGQHQVAVTFSDNLGRESGSTTAVALVCEEGQGITVANIPQPADASTVAINLYATIHNDPVLRLVAQLPPGTLNYLIGSSEGGRSLTTQFLQEMPAGQIVRYQNGRQFVARGRELLWSEPLRYGMFNPLRNRVRFTHDIDLAEPAGNDGFFIAAGARTFWLAGRNPAEYVQRTARAAGVVPGSPTRVPGNVLGLDSAEDLPVWLARTGHFCVGTPGGAVVVLKDGEAVVDGADRAALLFRQHDGLQQILAGLKGPRAQGLVFGDRAVARVVYDGSKG